MYNHIEAGSHLIHDGSRGYRFIDSNDPVYTHEEHNHSVGNFGQDTHSTSHIEQVWRWIKSEIKFLYRIIPHYHYILYFINKKKISSKNFKNFI